MTAASGSQLFRLNGRQGPTPASGWRLASSQQVEFTPQGLALARIPPPLQPLSDPTGSFGRLENPTGLAVAPDGQIYVADAGRHRLFRLHRRSSCPPQAHFFQVEPTEGETELLVYLPAALRLERWPEPWRGAPATYDGMEVIWEQVADVVQAEQYLKRYYAARDRGDFIIRRRWSGAYPESFPGGQPEDEGLRPLPCLGGPGWQPRHLLEPRGLAISRDGRLYVADCGNHRIQVFRLPDLYLQEIWGRIDPATGRPQAGPGLGEFQEPWDVALNSQGAVFIADRGNSRLQKYCPRERRFVSFTGERLLAHYFLVRYGPAAGDRFVYLPARRRLELWSRDLPQPPQTRQQLRVLQEDVPSLGAAWQFCQQYLQGGGAADLFATWEGPYPAALAAVPEPVAPLVAPSHLAVDAADQIYVIDAATEVVKVLNPQGLVVEEIRYVEEIKESFPLRALVVDAAGSLWLAGRQLWERRLAATSAVWHRLNRLPDKALALAAGRETIWLAGDGTLKLRTPAATAAYEKEGRVWLGPLDSGLENCQWHRVRLELAQSLPTGCCLTVWTYTAEQASPVAEILTLEPASWQAGPSQGPDFLILSPPGRYLWLRLDLAGTGRETPVLAGLEVEFPRVTYLQYLPAVYQTEVGNRDFLERFLALFEAGLSSIEAKLDHWEMYLDPRTTPAAPRDFLSWLAGWVGFTFSPAWPEATRRRLLQAVPELYRRRGTASGLKLLLKLALNLEVQIREEFCRRQWLYLGQSGWGGREGHLWGSGIVGRLQLSQQSQVGHFALGAPGDPLHDPFAVTAHRFTVYYRTQDLPDPAGARRLAALVDQEKPAHTQARLVAVAPRLRVGVQATVGVDTQIGGYPRAVLGRQTILNYNSILPRAPERAEVESVWQVGRTARLGAPVVVG